MPPFPTAEARVAIQAAFGGRPIETVCTTLSSHPIAAASLGQVRKGWELSSSVCRGLSSIPEAAIWERVGSARAGRSFGDVGE